MTFKPLFLFCALLNLSLLGQVFAEESHVDFTVSPAYVQDGNVQVAFEWLTPSQFRTKEIAPIDLQKINVSHLSSNQMVASKTAFVSKNSFDSFTYDKMNTSTYITEMLSSVGISKKTTDLWRVTNKVLAYRIPFKVSFDFKLTEATPATLGSVVTKYFKDESAGMTGTGRERFYILNMSNFTQLMHKNFSVVYIKEISAKETFILAVNIAGLDIDAANRYFNYPPFSTTKATMMKNLRFQTMHMVDMIQD